MPPRSSQLALALGVLGLIVLIALLPVGQWLLPVVEWVRGAGALGLAAFALLYVAATVLLLPASVLTLGAGFAYGPFWGTLLVSPVSVAAASAAFAVARRLGRRRLLARVENNQRVRALQEAVRERGLLIVLLLRLSPLIPFNLLNYGLGLTKISFRIFFLGSLVGMLPGTLMYVYLGSLVTTGSELLHGQKSASAAQQWLYWGGLLATIVSVILVSGIVRRAAAAIPALEATRSDAETVEDG